MGFVNRVSGNSTRRCCETLTGLGAPPRSTHQKGLIENGSNASKKPQAQHWGRTTGEPEPEYMLTTFPPTLMLKKWKKWEGSVTTKKRGWLLRRGSLRKVTRTSQRGGGGGNWSHTLQLTSSAKRTMDSRRVRCMGGRYEMAAGACSERDGRGS